MFSKVLVANRGEIAVRIIRALKELGISAVAVYSEADRFAEHVLQADEAYLLGPAVPSESYLNIGKLLEVVERSGSQAIHPGYGFLAENADFVRQLQARGHVFIGPSAQAIDAMGSKTKARSLMQQNGVPIVPGTTEPVQTLTAARSEAKTIGYPIAVKAAGGGGGKGFRVANSEAELQTAFEGAAREGEKFFSDPTVYLERYLPDPRHVEVQILADSHGNVIHLGERDCSVQRRHQKLVEESPAPQVSTELRERIGEIAINAAKAVNYEGAGTVEGLLHNDEYFFLEMNTRLQVEHCVTEATTGIDIVREQIRIAYGETLGYTQDQVNLRGHAIECRINAEDASKNFAPAPGTITHYHEPNGPGVRVDSGVRNGSEVGPMYDPLVAKLVVWDQDRQSATDRMLRALGEFELEGLKTLLPFHQKLLRSSQWNNGETCRDLIEDRAWLKTITYEPKTPDQTQANASPEMSDEQRRQVSSSIPTSVSAGDSRSTVSDSTDFVVEVSGKRFDVTVYQKDGEDGESTEQSSHCSHTRKAPKRRSTTSNTHKPTQQNHANGDTLTSPLQGNIFKVLVESGAEIEEGALVCIIEAMKMENEITAHKSGRISELPIREGAPVASGDTLAVIS